MIEMHNENTVIPIYLVCSSLFINYNKMRLTIKKMSFEVHATDRQGIFSFYIIYLYWFIWSKHQGFQHCQDIMSFISLEKNKVDFVLLPFIFLCKYK